MASQCESGDGNVSQDGYEAEGIGFVRFGTEMAKTLAIGMVPRPEVLNHRPMFAGLWRKERENPLGNVFIHNLDVTIDNEVLYDKFSAFGHILSCKVVKTLRGRSKGYGFVHFVTKEAADMAIEKGNGMSIKNTPVFVERAIPRQGRRSNPRELSQEDVNFVDYLRSSFESIQEKARMERMSDN